MKILSIFFLFILINPITSTEKSRPDSKSPILVGFGIRTNDQIESITPIFRPVLPNQNLGELFMGKTTGAKASKEILALRENAIIKGIILEKKLVQRKKIIQRIRIIWQRYLKGRLYGELILSDAYGVKKLNNENLSTEMFISDKNFYHSVKIETILNSDSSSTITNIELLTNDSSEIKNKPKLEVKSLVQYDFRIQIISGSKEGKVFKGSFSYNPNLLKKIGEETVEVESFSFSYEGEEFNEKNLDWTPRIKFMNNKLIDLSFVGGPNDKRFGLNEGFRREQFNRENEKYIIEGSSYFGYLDPYTYVDGAGKIEYKKVNK
jgi:hypothetical protein